MLVKIAIMGSIVLTIALPAIAIAIIIIIIIISQRSPWIKKFVLNSSILVCWLLPVLIMTGMLIVLLMSCRKKVMLCRFRGLSLIYLTPVVSAVPKDQYG